MEIHKKLPEGLLWAVYALRIRSLMASGRLVTEPIAVATPSSPLFWLSLARLLYGLVVVLACGCLRFLLGSLGCLLGVMLALVAFEWLGVSTRRGEYLLANVVSNSSNDAQYEQHRSMALYFFALLIRPLLLLLLLWRGDYAWIVPACVLWGASADVGLGGSPASLWREWQLPSVPLLSVCLVWPLLHWLLGRPLTGSMIAQGVLALGMMAGLAGLVTRIPLLAELPRQTRRQLWRWLCEVLILLVGLVRLCPSL